VWYCRIVELREFLKQVNHYCLFIKDYAAVVKPHSSDKPKSEVGMEQCTATGIQQHQAESWDGTDFDQSSEG